MIDSARSFLSLTFGLNPLWETVSSISKDIIPRALKVCYLAITIIPVFYFSNVYIIGFTAGFIFDEEVKKVVDKVNVVLNSRRTFAELFCLAAASVLLALYTKPMSYCIITLYYSAQWGAYLYKNSYERLQQARLPGTPMA